MKSACETSAPLAVILMSKRTAVNGLSLSAAAFVGLLAFEGYTDKAIIPTIKDRPTVGFGSTFHEDGRPVQLGETTDPVSAAQKAIAHIQKDERRVRESLPGVELNQKEYDLYLDWVYQYGIANWNNSTIRRRLIDGDHKGACDALLMWRYSGGYDCSTTINGQPNKRCWGVWTRQLDRHQKCLEAQPNE